MDDLNKFLNDEPGELDLSGDSEDMVLDLENANDAPPKFAPLPAGIYDCEIENAEYKKSQSGNPMIEWRFQTTDPQYNGRIFFYHTVLNSESGQGRLKKLILRLFPEVSLKGFKPKAFCDEGIPIGKACKVKVSQKTRKMDDGTVKRQNEVKDIMPAGDQPGGFLNGLE